MSCPKFTIRTHTLPCSPVREYPRGATTSSAVHWQLSVKQYIPAFPNDLLPNALTLLCTHANGLPRETYEPLFSDLVDALPAGSIHSIWIADCAHQGASAALNAGLLGDDPNWFDHSRDLLSVTDHFLRTGDMHQPIVGIGHSMGVAQLLRLAELHPRLMSGLALIEPVVMEGPPQGAPNVALGSSLRTERWSSREEAERDVRKGKMLRTWDKRVLEKFLEFGLKGEVQDDGVAKRGVTLSTSKAQEVWSFVRGNFADIGPEVDERRRAPDLDDEGRKWLFHRAEMVTMHRRLEGVRPRVLWIFGKRSPLNPKDEREDKLRRTGTGLGGNGGQAAEAVEEVVLEQGFHDLPQERPAECARALAGWLKKERIKFNEEQQWRAKHDRMVSEKDMTVLSQLWLKNVRKRESTPRNSMTKL
ncbi:hypothetical protein MMC25_007305 [Agyrium rufum]|nr:hypothetical protein [Agyrium rufum]